MKIPCILKSLVYLKLFTIKQYKNDFCKKDKNVFK